MSFYIKNGTRINQTDDQSVQVFEKLPAGNYIIKVDSFGNWYMEEVDRFEAPTRVYGDTLKNVDRIIKTYLDRPNGTGVMLAGEAGSGKTMLARGLSIAGYDLDIPTIIVSEAFCGENFNQYIQNINQPCIILFDEFEKVYSADKQESLLTLLDGVFPSKKLFVLTCNDKWRINRHMHNRPGRIYYALDFDGLDESFIREYCEENLVAKDQITNICNITSMFAKFTFDMLKAMVEEMNRYGETAMEVVKILNTKPENSSETKYRLEIMVNGVMASEYNDTIEINPLTVNGTYLSFKVPNQANINDSDDEDRWDNVYLYHTDLIKFDKENGQFIYRMNSKNYGLDTTIKISKKKSERDFMIEKYLL